MRNSVGKGGRNSSLPFSGGTGTGWLQSHSDPKSARDVGQPCCAAPGARCPGGCAGPVPAFPVFPVPARGRSRRIRCAPRSPQEMEAAPRKRPPSLPAGIDPSWSPPGASAAAGCTAGNCSSVAPVGISLCFVILFIYFSFLRSSCSPGSLVFLPVGWACVIPSYPYPEEFNRTVSYLQLREQILLLLAEGQRSSAGRTNLGASPLTQRSRLGKDFPVLGKEEEQE